MSSTTMSKTSIHTTFRELITQAKHSNLPHFGTNKVRPTPMPPLYFKKKKKIKATYPFITMAFSYVILDTSDIVPISCSLCKDNKPLNTYLYTQFEGLTIKEQSNLMLVRVLEQLVFIAKVSQIKYVYFDSYGSTTSILLLGALVRSTIQFTTLIREMKVYEIKIVKSTKKQTNTLICIRDYRQLINGSLETLYTEFVSEKQIPPKYILRQSLLNMTNESFRLCKEIATIRTLALFAIMGAAQAIIFDQFGCDINRSMTISSLSMRLFLTQFYEDNSIIMNNHHNAEFIRESYFGGHTDLYRPIADSVYGYDIN